MVTVVLADGFDDWLARIDIPSANPTWIAVSAIARAVGSHGNKVLLSGDGECAIRALLQPLPGSEIKQW